MIYQTKLRMCNYNVVAALQSMNETDVEFKAKIISYGRDKYSEYSTSSDDDIFKLVMANVDDLGWLDMFVDKDGNIYALKALKNIPIGTTLIIKKADGESVSFNVNKTYHHTIK